MDNMINETSACKKIRVLHILSNLDVNAGVMSVVMNYYRNINRNLIQFDFAYFFEVEGTYKDEIEELGGRYFFIGKPSFTLSYQKKIKQFFDVHKGEFNIIHCHPIWAAEVFAVQAKKHGIEHIVQHSHSTRYGNNRMSEVRNSIVMKVMSFFATDYAACSDEAAKLLQTKEKVTIFPNAIDCNNFEFDKNERNRIRHELNIKEDCFLIGHVGRFTAEKNQQFLIDVFKKIKTNYNNTRLVLVGDGVLKKRIEEYTKINNLENDIIFTGKRNDVPSLLSAFDVFVLPSKFEGVPYSVVEALASGLNCVISDSVTKAIKTDNTIYLDLNQNINIWANTILSISGKDRNLDSISTVRRMGFDIKCQAKKMEIYYLELASKKEA